MSKEIIALLKKIQRDAEAIERNSKAKGETVGKNREILAIQIELHCDQVLAALKEQPTIPKSITDYIQCPDSECCGCLVKEKQTRGVVCNKCGKKWGLFPHRTNKFSKAKQPKAEGDNRRLEVLRFNRNELFQETIKLKAELAEAKERIEGLEKVFGMDEPWSLLICAKQLVMSANHLLNDHNCDGDGYEKTEIAKRQMEKYIIRIEQALKAEQKG